MASDVEKVMVWAIIGEKTGAVIRTDHGTQAEMDKAAEFWKPHFCYVRQLVLAEALTKPAASGEVVAWQYQSQPNGKWINVGAEMASVFEANGWRVRPLYATPQPDADTVRDAERYRFIAADHSAAWEEELDAAIDAAITGEKS